MKPKQRGLFLALLVILTAGLVLLTHEQGKNAEALLPLNEKETASLDGFSALAEADEQTSKRINKPSSKRRSEPSKGEAVFHFVDPDGKDVSGMRVHLKMSSQSSNVRKKLETRVSNNNGESLFYELPPGEYAWNVAPQQTILSKEEGSFTIQAGVTTAETILVGTGTFVTGRLPLLSRAEKRPHLRLYKTLQGESSEEIPGGLYADFDGSFTFPATPGLGHLTAFWSEPDNTHYITAITLKIMEGGNDVGTLPLSSNHVELLVAFECNGRRYARDEVFETGTFSGVLAINSFNDAFYAEMVRLSLDEDPLIIGLWDGEWYASLLPRQEFPKTKPGFELRTQEPEIRFFAGQEERVELVYSVSKPVEATLEIVWSGKPFKGELYIRPKGSAEPNKTLIFEMKSDEVLALTIEEGQYDYLFLPHYAAGEQTNASSKGGIDVSPDERIRITAAPGAVFFGTTVPSKRVRASLEEWEGIYPFITEADKNGQWEIPGIPVSTTLYIDDREVFTGNAQGARVSVRLAATRDRGDH